AGNLLGTEQSGNLNAVGFDLYTRLLEEAVRELRGEAITRPRLAPVTMELAVDAYIPDDYIGDRVLKMNFYQRLAHLQRPEHVESMVAELADRFGPLPAPLANLLAIVRLKTEAAELGYESIAARDGEVILKLRRTIAADRVALYKRFRNDVRVELGEVRIPRRLLPEGTQAWLAMLHELLPLVAGGGKVPSAALADRGTGAGGTPGARPVPPAGGQRGVG
ncbi:MAG TPA: TRCF domain-containing protein, partial [Ktedonobacterales bacterium]|nr:TRCF domain-containing protein [Ktedonobacterales bacterium]